MVLAILGILYDLLYKMSLNNVGVVVTFWCCCDVVAVPAWPTV